VNAKSAEENTKMKADEKISKKDSNANINAKVAIINKIADTIYASKDCEILQSIGKFSDKKFSVEDRHGTKISCEDVDQIYFALLNKMSEDRAKTEARNNPNYNNHRANTNAVAEDQSNFKASANMNLNGGQTKTLDTSNVDMFKPQEMMTILYEYKNSEVLHRKLTSKIRLKVKKTILNNIENWEEFQADPIGYLNLAMPKLEKSFIISEKNMMRIYMQCFNLGAEKDDILRTLKQFISEEKYEGFVEKINQANIYPNPKYNKYNKRTRSIPLPQNVDSEIVKNDIQYEESCFLIKINTDMHGTDPKTGNPIAVNNLSRWFFGVPGARGHLKYNYQRDCIQLPGNTPDEAVELIEFILNTKEKKKDKQNNKNKLKNIIEDK